jgi:hypothetical protein
VFEEDVMRQLLGSVVVLIGCGLASGQSAWVPPGTYSQPFTPRLSTPVAHPDALVTPSLALDSPSPVVGASNGTMTSAIDSGVEVNQPTWYAPGVQFDRPLFFDSSIAPAQTQINFMEGVAREERRFDSGAAMFESSYGAAQFTGKRSGQKPSRVFTNADIARVNDANGTVKYSGKLAHLD